MRRLLLGIAVAVAALMPAVSMADDQQIADYIKSRLQVEQQRGNLRGFNVDMRVDRGTVWFKGFVSNSNQEMTILRAAQQAGHLGVIQVVDDIEVRSGNATAQTAMPQASYQQQAMQQQMMQQQAMEQQALLQQQQTMGRQAMMQQQPMGYQAMQQQMMQAYQPPAMPAANSQMGLAAYQEATNMPPIPNTIPQAPLDARGAMSGNSPLAFASSAQEVPATQVGAPMSAGGPAMGTETPNMPGYAWPGYAPHPNYAALTYPQQYSPQAWPYIGPFYPYPQVPLGWRKVQLEWDDGWWYLDFHDK